VQRHTYQIPKELHRKQLFPGDKFGRLTILEFAGSNHRNELMWLCSCICGNKKIIKGSNLRNCQTKSCGCRKKEYLSRFNDITGNKYGKLTVLKYLKHGKGGHSIWLCKCECGEETERWYQDLTSPIKAPRLVCLKCQKKICSAARIRIGDASAKKQIGNKFGHLTLIDVKEKRGKRQVLCECVCGNTIAFPSLAKIKKSHCGCLSELAYITHGKSHIVGYYLYKKWTSLRRKNLLDRSYSFPDFEDWAIGEGWEPGLYIYRIDHSKPYSTTNCFMTEKSLGHGHLYDFKGIKMPLGIACYLYGHKSVTPSLAWRRLRYNGLTPEEAISIPKFKV
jgi:hypothetical protein